MPHLQYVGLLVALVSAPVLLALFKSSQANATSPVPRFSLWVAAAFVVAVAAATARNGLVNLGLGVPTWANMGLAIVAAAAIFIALGLAQLLQRKLGAGSDKQWEQYQDIVRRPFGHRLFLVATAAVTEEVLYRGYAIGVGQSLLGSLWLACVLSVTAFTLAHARWGRAHLLPVFIAAVVFALLFAYTQNLWACMLAHAIVDAVGFLLVPALMARKRPRSIPHAG